MYLRLLAVHLLVKVVNFLNFYKRRQENAHMCTCITQPQWLLKSTYSILHTRIKNNNKYICMSSFLTCGNIPESIFSEVLGRYFVDIFSEYFLCSLWLYVRLIGYQLQQTQLFNGITMVKYQSNLSCYTHTQDWAYLT